MFPVRLRWLSRIQSIRRFVGPHHPANTPAHRASSPRTQPAKMFRPLALRSLHTVRTARGACIFRGPDYPRVAWYLRRRCRPRGVDAAGEEKSYAWVVNPWMICSTRGLLVLPRVHKFTRNSAVIMHTARLRRFTEIRLQSFDANIYSQ